MFFCSIASRQSVWNAYDYYKNGKVLYCDKINDTEFLDACEGSNEEKYEIYMDTDHHKHSTCTCPYAKGSSKTNSSNWFVSFCITDRIDSLTG